MVFHRRRFIFRPRRRVLPRGRRVLPLGRIILRCGRIILRRRAGFLQKGAHFVAQIKRSPNYNDSIGHLLKIIGEEDTTEHSVPDFTLEVERGSGCECVRVRFKKHGHKGVVVFCRRGNGEWEMLGIDLASPYMDERPLLNATQPEIREYRLQYYDNDGPNGEMSPVQKITINP